MRNIVIEADHENASRSALARIVKVAGQGSGPVRVALSGGSTPNRLFALWAGMGPAFPWERVELFWVDERCVEPGHAQSNFAACREHLLDHIPLPPEQIYRMHGELGAKDGAPAYAATLREVFGPEADLPRFDLVLLGMGADGHIASLFPGHEALDAKGWVAPVADAPGNPAVDRITLTLPVLNAARVAVLLVTGAGKGETARAVLDGNAELPAGLVEAQETVWVLDEASAGQ